LIVARLHRVWETPTLRCRELGTGCGAGFNV
jgi:hypothetical protein